MVFYISGHLDEDRAKDIFQNKIIRHIKHAKISESELPRFDRMLRVKKRFVYTY
jgi:hypothetical protein